MVNVWSVILILYLDRMDSVLVRMSFVKKWINMELVLNVWILTTILIHCRNVSKNHQDASITNKINALLANLPSLMTQEDVLSRDASDWITMAADSANIPSV